MSEQKKPREFDKVDRALEAQVIDWLQWSQFPENIGKNPDDSDMAQLTLTLLGKRKLAYDQAQAEIKRLREALELISTLDYSAPNCEYAVNVAREALKETNDRPE